MARESVVCSQSVHRSCSTSSNVSDLEQMKKDKESKGKRPGQKAGSRRPDTGAASDEMEEDSDSDEVSPRKVTLKRTKLLRAKLDSDESDCEVMAGNSKRLGPGSA